MKDRKKRKRFQLNNRGSVLVTVVIVIAFVCVLATLILYLSVMNYQMKSTDFKTKVSFYGAETPLEELRMQMAADLSFASEEAYIQVMTQYGALTSADLRSAEYEKIIWESIQDVWNTRTTDPLAAGTDWCYGIGKALKEDLHHAAYPKKYHIIADNAAGNVLTCGVASCDAAYHVIVKDMGANQLELVDTATDHYIVLRGVKVSYTEDSFSSVISTEFCMNIPKYDWSVDASSGSWVDGVSSTTRSQIDYEKCVVYLNYMKQ